MQRPLKKTRRRGDEGEVKKPLYTHDDVRAVFDSNIQYAEYDKPITLAKDVQVTFRNAGHILGSATLQIDFEEQGQSKTVVFSGDLGNSNDLVMPDPQLIKSRCPLY